MSTLEHRHEHTVEEVFALLVDPGFLERRAAAAGDQNIQLDVDPVGDTIRIRLVRDVISDIPSFAKRMFEPKNRVAEETIWRTDGERRRGTYHVEVGDRIRIQGALTLTPAPGGSLLTQTIEATVNVPLIGKRLVGFITSETEKGVRKNLEFTDRELRG